MGAVKGETGLCAIRMTPGKRSMGLSRKVKAALLSKTDSHFVSNAVRGK
jgi:hypothetical protein